IILHVAWSYEYSGELRDCQGQSTSPALSAATVATKPRESRIWGSSDVRAFKVYSSRIGAFVLFRTANVSTLEHADSLKISAKINTSLTPRVRLSHLHIDSRAVYFFANSSHSV